MTTIRRPLTLLNDVMILYCVFLSDLEQQLFVVYFLTVESLSTVQTHSMRKPPLPRVSAVLTAYLKQCNEPPWTSYFIRVCQSENGKSK